MQNELCRGVFRFNMAEEQNTHTKVSRILKYSHNYLDLLYESIWLLRKLGERPKCVFLRFCSRLTFVAYECYKDATVCYELATYGRTLQDQNYLKAKRSLHTFRSYLLLSLDISIQLLLLYIISYDSIKLVDQALSIGSR